MRPSTDLRNMLRHIDGRGYKAYKDIRDVYDFGTFSLIVDHVQGDPYAAPSRVRVRVPHKNARFPGDTRHNRSREVALRDFLTRRFFEATRKFCRGGRGIGKSGVITIDRPGQEILERTSAFVTQDHVETRFVMGLPAFGRNVAGSDAEAMFFDELPRIVEEALFFENVSATRLYEHVRTSEDADCLREKLDSLGLIAFVADGAILPRASGVDQRPLSTGTVVAFESPPSLRVEVELPNRGTISGMGVPRGVTLIVGGGYHGKSTLLRALERGIYNHIPGDGREYVVTGPDAVKIRAEDNRRIEKVDISSFIVNLPFGRDTRSFSTDDASGSTSQAANIMESLEMGASVLLIDEDTSATNFMIRDRRMQELVSKDKEPITPFIDKIRQMYRELEVSSILALGGSGDYFDVADCVLCMVEYRPVELTEEARSIACLYRTERNPEGGESFGKVTGRIPLARGFDPRRGKRDVKISSRGLRAIEFGTGTIDLGAVEQLVDVSQTRAIGDAIHYATEFMDGKRTLREIVAAVLEAIKEESLDVLGSWPAGDYAAFRGMELAAAINRLRTLAVRQKD